MKKTSIGFTLALTSLFLIAASARATTGELLTRYMSDKLPAQYKVTDSGILEGLRAGTTAIEVPRGEQVALTIPSQLRTARGLPYTLVLKIKVTDVSNGKVCLVNMPDNNSDAMIYLGETDRKVRIKQSSKSTVSAVSSRAVPLNTWTVLAFAFGSNSTEIYMDGERVYEGAATLANSFADCYSAAGGEILVGADDNGEDNPFYLADARLYDGAVAVADELPGTGVKNDPFRIASAADWELFASNVNRGMALGDERPYYRLETSIGSASEPITQIVGTDSHHFRGDFDGGSNTIHVALSGSDQGTALFARIDRAIISHLKVSGSVTSSANYAAALVGICCSGTNMIQHCDISADVTVTGAGHAGGIIGNGGSDHTLVLYHSVYSGTISGFTEHAGGLLGWCDSLEALYLGTSLFKGSFSPGSSGKYHPIACKSSSSSFPLHVTTANEAVSGITVYYLNTVTPTESVDHLVIEGRPVSATYVPNLWEESVTAIDGNVYYAQTAIVLTPQTGSARLTSGAFVTGTGGPDTHVVIEDGATVTLYNVCITNITADMEHRWAGITCAGDATIILQGDNFLTGGHTNTPAIFVFPGKTLTIRGDGTLDASSHGYGAGIGGGFGATLACGNIVIASGTITATGGIGAAAGIGSGMYSSCGTITISGGTITATGGLGAAGIGNGMGSTCGDILISGGDVTATGNDYAAGIGGGADSTNETITVSGGTVTATGGQYGAGIGGGANGICGDIVLEETVTVVTATYGADSPTAVGVGAGSGSCGTVTIGGTVMGDITDNPFVYTPYIITNITSLLDWKLFAVRVNYGLDDYDGKTVTLATDLTVSTMVGTTNHPFRGTFAGDGHTLSDNITSSEANAAPFRHIDGATITNLIVAGTVSSTGFHAAGLVGRCGDTRPNTILDCTVATSVNGFEYAGGIVGHGGNGTLRIERCIFSGSVSGFDKYAGGLLGWCDALTLTIRDCLSKGSFAPSSSGLFHPVACKFDGSAVAATAERVYYLNTVAPTATGDHLVFGATGEPVSTTYVADVWTIPETAIDGRTYYSAPVQTAIYWDPVGKTSAFCASYTPYSGQTRLESGWWIISDSWTIDGRITVHGDVNLLLCDGKTLTANKGVNVSVDGTTTNRLIIWAQSDGAGMGALTANGDSTQAGIGSDKESTGGIVVVNGGTITANGGSQGAGIGGGAYSAGGIVTINGGTISAKGGRAGAGIGGGEFGAGSIVVINGGMVTATGGSGTGNGSGAGIGGGGNGAGGTVSISGGDVTAIGASGFFGGAGIGGSKNGAGGKVTISGGTVNAKGGKSAAGIGGGEHGAGGTISISGGMVTATGGNKGAGIGGGNSGAGGTVAITGGIVTAIAGVNAEAIGKGNGGSSSDSITFYDDAVVFTNVFSHVAFTGTEREGACRGAWARMVPGSAFPPVPYLDPTDPTNTNKTCLNYTFYTDQNSLTSGWWVVLGNITNANRIAISGDVHLLLMDDAELTAQQGVDLPAGDGISLTVWAQCAGDNAGKLTATANSINDFTGAGIGGGGVSGVGGGTLTVNGGTITAFGSLYAAGIGGGGSANDVGGSGGTVTINGGTVKATGGTYGAGIGGGKGQIGGSGGMVTINGGTVEATGSINAAGIGGAFGNTGGNGGEVTITGGTVTAIAGESAHAIGGSQGMGYGGDPGSLSIDGMKVFSPETATDPVDATNRIAACHSQRVKLTVCDSHSFTAYRNNGDDHTLLCQYCGAAGDTEAHSFSNLVCVCGASLPTFEIKVQDTNDTTGETSGWQDTADYDIGDAVPFKLTATLPRNVTDFLLYHVTFECQLEGSFEFQGIDRVFLNSQNVPSSKFEVHTDDDQNFTVTLRWGDGTGKIVDEDLNDAAVDVYFTATLKDNAVLGRQGNVCGARLRHSFNPASTGDGDKDERKTEWDFTAVFTYGLEVHTLNAAGAAVSGAAFTLEKMLMDGTKKRVDGGFVATGTFRFSGLDDGNYTLTETAAPVGQETHDPISFTIAANHGVEWEGGNAAKWIPPASRTNLLSSLAGNAPAGRPAFTADGDLAFLVCDIEPPPPPNVSNVVVTAPNPWTGDGKVDISFTTGGTWPNLPDWNQPFLSIVATDNMTGSNYVADVSALTVDTGVTEPDHRVTWDVGKQGIVLDSTNVTFSVAYLNLPEYCVIDLSGGPDAESYPVSYLDEEPEGGLTNDLYRTEKLAMRLVSPPTTGTNRYDFPLRLSINGYETAVQENSKPFEFVAEWTGDGAPNRLIWKSNVPGWTSLLQDMQGSSNSLSFATASDIGMLEPGKLYEMRAETPDGVRSNPVRFGVYGADPLIFFETPVDGLVIAPNERILFRVSFYPGEGENGTPSIKLVGTGCNRSFNSGVKIQEYESIHWDQPGEKDVIVYFEKNGKKTSDTLHVRVVDLAETNALFCAVFETTQGQWQSATGGNPSAYTGVTRPVESVSWNDIRGADDEVDDASFLGVLRAKTGLAALDLPTEAQWEHACHAGTMGDFAGTGVLDEMGRHSGNLTDGRGGYEEHTTVGSYLPNDWGLHDFHGNVWEWSLGEYKGSRIVRGGGWMGINSEGGSGFGGPQNNSCTSFARAVVNPTNASDRCGFRLVLPMSSDAENERRRAAAADAACAGLLCTGTSKPISLMRIENVPFSGTFTLAGRDMAPGEFTAGLYLGEDLLQTATNTVDGSFAFKPLQYTLADKGTNYTYTVRQEAGTSGNILYDGTNHMVTVSVVDDGNGSFAVNATENHSALNFANEVAVRLIVTVGKWGAVAVTANGAELATIGPDATTNVVVGYGSSVTARAVPNAGFVVNGDADSVSFASFTNAAEAAFAFLPRPEALIRWTFSPTMGRHFAQIAMTNHAGYAEALEGLAYVFADRTNAAGTVYAQLWDAAAKTPQGVLFASGGAEQRGVALDTAAFGGLAEGARAVWGVSDATLADAAGAVPADERQIGMYVRNRVAPASGNEAAGEVKSFVGYLTWTTDGKRYHLPIVEGAATGDVTTETTQTSTTATETGSGQASVTYYKVVFAANGGTGLMTAQKIAGGVKAKLRPCAYKRKGWLFLGWAKSKNGAVAYRNAASVKNLAKNGTTVTLYAKWAKKTYKVAFYRTYKSATGKMAKQTFPYGKGKRLSKNKFTREGYTFKGWAKSKALAKKGKVAYKNRKKVKNLVANGKTVKLYAVWKKE